MKKRKEIFYAIGLLNRRNKNGEKSNCLHYFEVPENRDFEPCIGNYAIVEYDNGFELASIIGTATISALRIEDCCIKPNRILGILDFKSGMSPVFLKMKVDEKNNKLP